MNAIQHLKKEAIAGGVTNAAINGILGWLIFGGGPPLTWTGEQNIAADVIATCLLLPLLLTLILIPIQRAKRKKGELTSIDLGPESRWQRLANRLPSNTFWSAVLFALAGTCLIAPTTLAVFHYAGITAITPLYYSLFKAAWAGAMAAAIVPLLVLVALRKDALTHL